MMECPATFALRAARRGDGTWLLEPLHVMRAMPERLTDRLVHWAHQAPDSTFLAARDGHGAWRVMTYADTLSAARLIAAALLTRPLSADRPIAILSGNSIEHQLLALGAMYAGIPYVPVSSAYSLTEGAGSRLRQALNLLTPGLVAVFGGAEYARALREVDLDSVELVTLDTATFPRSTPFASLLAVDRVDAADAAHARLTADTIAKFLLTSGSTGHPKAVITTHRMLASNQAMIQQAMPFLLDEPPVLVDWLPWNHVFGGSHNVGIALMNGGSYYIDAGRPTAEGIAETARNLREIAPTVYLNVPLGFDMLLPVLKQDAELQARFFSRLRTTFVAGAGLSQETWNGYLALSRMATGRVVPMINGIGATETAPSVTFAVNATQAGFVGWPAAGCTVKLAPINDKLEMRVRGPNVMPGYWRDPERTAAAYDDEGYYRMGDAIRLADPADPRAGLFFDGRINEDFKLSTGTWVSVGPLRASLLAALAPLCRDVVIAGANRELIGVLVIPDPRGCASVSPELKADVEAGRLAESATLRRELHERLARHAAAHPASSASVRRALVIDRPPQLGSGEITDKGTINQRAMLDNRRSLVDKLYAPQPANEVICIP